MAESFTLSLASRACLVTGGSRGIGRAVSRLLARAGARVAFSYRSDESSANSLVKEIRAEGGEAMALAADVSRAADARQMVRDVVAAWQRLDILVNNAGVWEEDQAGAGDLDTWDRAFGVNARGAFLVTDAAVPHLQKEKGSIVFVASTAAQRGEARHAAYAASKGALCRTRSRSRRSWGPAASASIASRPAGSTRT